MSDQAAELRRLMAAQQRTARIIAVTSGKGGVGKTNLSVNLAVALSQLEKRVLVLDADLGLANVNVLLDIQSRYNLLHVIAGKKTLQEVITPGPAGIGVIPGAQGIVEMADLPNANRSRLIESLRELESLADYVIIDTAAGISRSVMNFLLAADEVLLITTPETPAQSDAYAVAKQLARAGEDREREHWLVVNFAQHRPEAERVAANFCRTCHEFLGLYVGKLGYLPTDPCVPQAVRNQKPFLLEYPKSSAGVCVKALASNLLGRERPRHTGKPGFLDRLATILHLK